MIDKTVVKDKDGKEFMKCECDCGYIWYLPKAEGDACVKCIQCGSKSCGG